MCYSVVAPDTHRHTVLVSALHQKNLERRVESEKLTSLKGKEKKKERKEEYLAICKQQDALLKVIAPPLSNSLSLSLSLLVRFGRPFFHPSKYCVGRGMKTTIFYYRLASSSSSSPFVYDN